ncbi:MAG: FdrA family protein, partial [Pseudonocardiales bacterium]|nr:FdrA family protein [Pseudonocardiales bacterium]
MTRVVELRRGSYRDSVTLMQVTRAVSDVPGVTAALVAMATELNLELLDGMGFAPPPDLTPNDMVVAIDAAGDGELATARD